MCDRHEKYYRQFDDENLAARALAEDPGNPDLVIDYLHKKQETRRRDYLEESLLLEKLLKRYPEYLNREFIRGSNTVLSAGG